MSRFIKGKDGKFAGSIGDGRNLVPTAADLPSPPAPPQQDAPSTDATAVYQAYDAHRDEYILTEQDSAALSAIMYVRRDPENGAAELEAACLPTESLRHDVTGWYLDSGTSAPIRVNDLIALDGPSYAASLVSAAAHRGQTDKLGVPYGLHPFGVARILETLDEFDALSSQQRAEAKAAAYLHDVLEDTPITREDLADMGFSPSIIDTVEAVTARDGESKDAYYARVIEQGPLAVAVKLADLGHNNLPARRACLPGAPGNPVPDGGVDQYVKLGKKYAKAYAVLGSTVPEHLREFVAPAETAPVDHGSASLGGRPPLPEWRRSDNPHHRL